jgi:two-component system, chemotaxis family, CheB/CheR fusion protein
MNATSKPYAGLCSRRGERASWSGIFRSANNSGRKERTGQRSQAGGGDGASLRQLLTTELAPYDRNGQSLSITGADIVITPRAGLSLAMAFHELTSNAAKYGALSADTGALVVSWSVSHKSPAILHFVWTESGGPPIVEPPSKRGFGSTLIERTLSHEMDAVVRQDFRPSGLHCTIDIPLTDDVGQMQGFSH